LQVNGQWFHVIVESQIAERHQQVVPVDCLAILRDATFDGLTANEGYELGDTLLDALSCILGYLAVLGHRNLHDLNDVADGQKSVLFA